MKTKEGNNRDKRMLFLNTGDIWSAWVVAIYWDVNHPPSTGVMIPNPGPLTVCKAVQGWDVNMACSRLVV